MPNDPNNSDPGQVPANQNPQPQAGNSIPQAGNEPPTNVSLTIAEDLQRQIAELRRENAAHRKKNKDAEDAAALAEQQRLKEQGEFKKLAEQHETRVKELEPVATSYAKLAEQIQAQIEAEIKDWPAEVKALVPGSDVPAEQRLEQMTRLRPLLEKLQVQARGQNPGNRPNPQPANQQDARQQRIEATRAAAQQRRSYGI
jgi:hypothetical protein